MNKAGIAGWWMCGLILFGAATAAVAQEGSVGQQGTVSVEAEEPEYAFGTVKKMSDDKKFMVVTEFSYETGDEGDVTYSLDSKTQLSGVKDISEIKPGDEVDVDFVVKDGKNTAVALSVAKPVEEEES